MFKGGTAAAGATAEQDLPLSYARTLSWLSLLVIMATSLVLSFFIANSAREALLTRQENFSRLLAENLNHQIYRRFALPTLLAHGRIALRQPSQYDRLDQVVQSVVHGLPMERLRIYDFTRVVAYSTSKEELGRMGVGPESLDSTLRGGVPKPELISNIPDWRAIFHLPRPSGTFVLRTLYPLRGEPLQPGAEPPIMGALELTQDITSDYEQILLFQGVVVVTCLLSSVIMFALLLMLIQRAERVLADRMAKNRQLENELHSNEKLVSMGRVIASIAHEIRNPLGIIRSSAELLQRRMGKADAGASRILQAIYDESVRLSQTVNDFLDYARPRQPRQDLVDLDLVLSQVLAFLGEQLGRDVLSIPTDRRGNRRLSANVFLEQAEKFDWPDPEAPESGTEFCHGLRQQLAVLCDGTAVPCCLDGEGRMALGNLFDQPVEEILASPRAAAIREGFSRRSPAEELCRRCGYAARF